MASAESLAATRQAIIAELTAELESACSEGAAKFSIQDPLSTTASDNNYNLLENVGGTATSANPNESAPSIARTSAAEDSHETAAAASVGCTAAEQDSVLAAASISCAAAAEESVGCTAFSEQSVETAETVNDASASGVTETVANGEALEDGEIDDAESDDGPSTRPKQPTVTALAIESIPSTSPTQDYFDSGTVDNENLPFSPVDVDATPSGAALLHLDMAEEGESAAASIIPSQDALFKVY